MSRHRAVARQRGDVEHVRQDELRIAVLGVLLQQLVQDLAGLGSIPGEEVLVRLSQTLRSLAAGAKRGVEGQVTEEVERVGLGLLGGLGEFREVDAALFELPDDLGPLLRVGPLGAQFRSGRAEGPDLSAAYSVYRTTRSCFPSGSSS